MSQTCPNNSLGTLSHFSVTCYLHKQLLNDPQVSSKHNLILGKIFNPFNVQIFTDKGNLGLQIFNLSLVSHHVSKRDKNLFCESGIAWKVEIKQSRLYIKMNSSANNFLFHNIIFTELKALGTFWDALRHLFPFLPL